MSDVLRSETDYGGDDVVFHAPRPRHYSATAIQPWLQVLDHDLPRSLSPLPNRVASPLVKPTVDDSRPSSPWRAPQAPFGVNDIPRPSTLHNSRMDGPARRWVRWMAKMGLKDAVVPSIMFVALTARWLVGLGGYSGEVSKTVSRASLIVISKG